MHRNLLLPVDFLMFLGQAGPQAVSGESQSAVPCGSGRSSVVDDQEDAQSRTMNWLMQSPVRAEAGSESVLEGSDVGDTSLVLAMEMEQSEALLNCAPEDFECDYSSHARPTSSSVSVHDTRHLPTDVPVTLSDSLIPDEVELEEVVCTDTHRPLQFSQDMGEPLDIQTGLFVRCQARDLWRILNLS